MTSYTTVSLSIRQTTIRSHMSKAEQKEEHTNRFEHSVSKGTLVLSKRLTKSSTRSRKFTEIGIKESGPLTKCVH